MNGCDRFLVNSTGFSEALFEWSMDIIACGVSSCGLFGMQTLYDVCASWWTQRVSADMQPLARQNITYGNGQYRHVLFPEAGCKPALRLGEKLLETVGWGWASRMFFSGDGCVPLMHGILCWLLMSD